MLCIGDTKMNKISSLPQASHRLMKEEQSREEIIIKQCVSALPETDAGYSTTLCNVHRIMRRRKGKINWFREAVGENNEIKFYRS